MRSGVLVPLKCFQEMLHYEPQWDLTPFPRLLYGLEMQLSGRERHGNWRQRGKGKAGRLNEGLGISPLFSSFPIPFPLSVLCSHAIPHIPSTAFPTQTQLRLESTKILMHDTLCTITLISEVMCITGSESTTQKTALQASQQVWIWRPAKIKLYFSNSLASGYIIIIIMFVY